MQTQEYVIERGASVRLASALRELWTYRAIILAFSERNIWIKYKQAALGIAWAVIPHVTQHDQADVSGVEEFRKLHGARAEKDGAKITVT